MGWKRAPLQRERSNQGARVGIPLTYPDIDLREALGEALELVLGAVVALRVVPRRVAALR